MITKEQMLSFNQAQIILGKEDTTGKHNLTTEQLQLCAHHGINIDLITNNNEIILIIKFSDNSKLRHKL